MKVLLPIFWLISLSGTWAQAEPIVIDRLEASVNSSMILLSDVKKFKTVVKLRSQLDPLFAGTPVAAHGAQATHPEIVNFLVDENLITQKFPVTDAETEQDISTIQANNRIDRNTLKSALAEQGYQFEDYFELIRKGSSKRNLIDRDIRTKVVISEDDLKNYFYNHYTKDPKSPKAYHLQLLSISTQDYKSVSAAKDVATRALAEIKKGEVSFEEVAKQFGDAHTSQSAGDLGIMTEDQISPAIQAQLKGLQIGGVSSIFGGASEQAFYILRLKDIKTADTERFNQVKEEIRGLLAATEYHTQISLWLERERQTAFIHRAGEPTTQGLPVTK